MFDFVLLTSDLLASTPRKAPTITKDFVLLLFDLNLLSASDSRIVFFGIIISVSLILVASLKSVLTTLGVVWIGLFFSL